MKDVYYFSHDANARHDPKMTNMLLKHKSSGYGVYWVIIEMLREGSKNTLNITDYDAIAYQSHSDKETVKSVVSDFGLFEIEFDTGNFYSKSLNRRIEEYNIRRNKLSEAGKIGNSIRWASGGDRKGIALKESKVNNIKAVDNTPLQTKPLKNKPSSAVEVMEYMLSIGMDGSKAETFIDHYEGNGWIRGKTPIKDWKACVRTWKHSEINSTKTNPQKKPLRLVL